MLTLRFGNYSHLFGENAVNLVRGRGVEPPKQYYEQLYRHANPRINPPPDISSKLSRIGTRSHSRRPRLIDKPESGMALEMPLAWESGGAVSGAGWLRTTAMNFVRSVGLPTDGATTAGPASAVLFG